MQQRNAPSVINTAAVYGLSAPAGTASPEEACVPVSAFSSSGAHEPIKTPDTRQTMMPLRVGTAPATPRAAYAKPIKITATNAIPTPEKSSVALPAG